MIGVSPDSVERQATFKQKENLPFTLLADEKHDVAEQYGTWVEKSNYGKKYWGVERSTFIINHIGIETKHQLPIIGVGGIRSAADIQAKLDAGASLVQLYTAIVYEGPGLAGRMLRSLK